MKNKSKRFSISLKPEWDDAMRALKKEKFYDKSQSEMIRHLIERGLELEVSKRPTSA